MKINSSIAGMESDRTYRSESTRKLSSSLKVTGNSSLRKKISLSSKPALFADSFKPENFKNAYGKLSNTAIFQRSRIQEIAEGMQRKSIERIRQSCVLHLWELLFGKEKADNMADFYQLTASTSNLFSSPPGNNQRLSLSTQKEVIFSEEESMSFQTDGTVVTDDGREISFHLNVSMSRSFSAFYRQEKTEEISMCDPLIIQMDSSFSNLSDQSFFFDLDCDGTGEELSSLPSGTGFLALDKNRDEIINDGSELFGTGLLDSFSDLAQYDSDHNGWIDENDSVFSHLKIWTTDETGNSILYSLKDKKIGSLCLASAETNFTLRSESSGSVTGAIRKSGVFLYEDGRAGSLHHLDMVPVQGSTHHSFSS